MARVDFYILSRQGPRERQLFACRLAEKAYRLDNTVHIHTDSPDVAEQIDEMLWTFRDGSFVPHCLSDADDGTENSPIVIGSDHGGVVSRDLLINLSDDIPSFADAFPRVAEVVTSDENCRLMSRKRYATYRDQGHTINTHKL